MRFGDEPIQVAIGDREASRLRLAQPAGAIGSRMAMSHALPSRIGPSIAGPAQRARFGRLPFACDAACSRWLLCPSAQDPIVGRHPEGVLRRRHRPSAENGWVLESASVAVAACRPARLASLSSGVFGGEPGGHRGRLVARKSRMVLHAQEYQARTGYQHHDEHDVVGREPKLRFRTTFSPRASRGPTWKI